MDTLKLWKNKFTKDNYFNYGRKFALVSNVLFECISIALFIGGFAVRFGAQTINSTTLHKIKDSAINTYGVYLSTDNFRPITESLYQAFGTALILIGLFTAPFGVFGFYSLFRKKMKLLVAYVVIVGCLLFIQVILNYHFITSPETVQQWMKPYLQEKIKEYYGIDSSDHVSLGWNYLMQEYQCCGIDSSADFQSSSYYNARGYCWYYTYHNVPGCCKTLPSYSASSYCGAYQAWCGQYPFDSNYANYWQGGCIQALFNANYSRNTVVIWAMTGVGMLVQILLFVFAVTLIKHIKCRIEPSVPSVTSETQIWTAESHSITGTPNQLPPQATTLQPKPSVAQLHQPQAMTVTAPRQHSLYSSQVPPTTASAAAQPPEPQPVLQASASRQDNFYPAQPFLPGAVMLVPTPLDYSQMTRQTSYIPMTPMPVYNIRSTHTQLPPRTPTALPSPGEQPIYVQTPADMQPENRRTLSVTEEN